jgi:hypothetical protein
LERLDSVPPSAIPPGIRIRQARAFPVPGETPSYIIDFGIVLGALCAAGPERPGRAAASAAQARPKDALRTEPAALGGKLAISNVDHGRGTAGATRLNPVIHRGTGPSAPNARASQCPQTLESYFFAAALRLASSR